MRLKSTLRASVAAICIAALAAPAGFAETPPLAQHLPGSALSVSVAQSTEFSRVEFRFAGGAHMTSRRQGQTLTLHFSRYARPDMSRLRVDPPRWLKTASDRNAGGLEIVLTLADDADARAGEADGASFVNLFAKNTTPPIRTKPAAPAVDARTQTALSNRPDPTPAGGVVRMRTEMVSGRVLLHFLWKNPLGAAVFRRGEAIWVVFDVPARIDLVSAAPPMASETGPAAIQALQGTDYSAVRIASPADVGVSVIAQGSEWIITLGNAEPAPVTPVKVTRDDDATTATLSATVAGATRAVWVDDRWWSVTRSAWSPPWLSPARASPSRRSIQRRPRAALLPTANGLAVEPIADNIAVSTDGDIVSIGKPDGLALSPKSAHAQLADDGPGLPQPLSHPALIDYDTWGQTGSGGFMPRYDALQSAAAAELDKGKDAGMTARMGLVRFLIGSDLSFEAIGMLNTIAKSQQTMLGDAEFRGLRGAAKVMAGQL